MRWLHWFGNHVGIALLGATVWLMVVVVVYAAWVVWGGWDRESDLALAQALAPVAGAGFALVVVNAAVLAFRPPQPELSCFVRDIGSRRGAPSDGPRFTIVNSGRLPASDVTIEIVGGRFGGNLRIVSPFWEATTKDARMGHLDDRMDGLADLSPDPAPYRTVLERSRPLPNNSSEVVFFGHPDIPLPPDPVDVRVRVTASNAAAVTYEPSRHDWDEWYVADMLTAHTPHWRLEFDIQVELKHGQERFWGVRYRLVRYLYVRSQLVRWRIFGGCPYSTRPVSKPVSNLTEDDRGL